MFISGGLVMLVEISVKSWSGKIPLEKSTDFERV
jgi:hypothetical protein